MEPLHQRQLNNVNIVYPENLKNSDENRPVIPLDGANGPESAIWRSESRISPPKRIIIVDDTISGDTAFRNASQGVGMLWQGDFQNAKQLLNAMARRVSRGSKKKLSKKPRSPAEAFHWYRMGVSNRARILGMLLIEVEPDHSIRLSRAPDTRVSITEALGAGANRSILPLREILGIVGAHEWRRKGIDIPFLGGRIYPHYGVFCPIRNEYTSLVINSSTPPIELAFDIGTGTGVLAAILAKKGVREVIATDNDPRAIACARENMLRLGLSERVRVMETNLFPPLKAPLIVCNPPWIPARPVTSMEKAIYDPESQMLRMFLQKLPEYLEPRGEAWLILSDLAEHLGLRTRTELTDAFKTAGLKVLDKIDTPPTHSRAQDKSDPLYAARAAEITSLWRLTSLDT